MSLFEEKVVLVNKIIRFHPASGVDKGWSWYVGGMRDTGDWYQDKLYVAPIKDLYLFLNELEEGERNYVPPVPDNSPIIMGPNGIWMTEKTKENIAEFNRKTVNRILFGKPTTT
jgi:hypothetical protein